MCASESGGRLGRILVVIIFSNTLVGAVRRIVSAGLENYIVFFRAVSSL